MSAETYDIILLAAEILSATTFLDVCHNFAGSRLTFSWLIYKQ